MWQPIKTAPTLTVVLVGRRGHLPCIAMLDKNRERWGECLGGDYYGTKPPFEPTHWQVLEPPPE